MSVTNEGARLCEQLKLPVNQWGKVCTRLCMMASVVRGAKSVKPRDPEHMARTIQNVKRNLEAMAVQLPKVATVVFGEEIRLRFIDGRQDIPL